MRITDGQVVKIGACHSRGVLLGEARQGFGKPHHGAPCEAFDEICSSSHSYVIMPLLCWELNRPLMKGYSEFHKNRESYGEPQLTQTCES